MQATIAEKRQVGEGERVLVLVRRRRTIRTTGRARTSGSSCRTGATATRRACAATSRSRPRRPRAASSGSPTTAPRHRVQADARASSRCGDEVAGRRSRRARSCCPEDTDDGVRLRRRWHRRSRSSARCSATSPTSRCRTASRSSTRTATASRAAVPRRAARSSSERIDGLTVVLTMTDEPDWAGETAPARREVLGELARRPRREAVPRRRAAADGRGASPTSLTRRGSARGAASSRTSSPATEC